MNNLPKPPKSDCIAASFVVPALAGLRLGFLHDVFRTSFIFKKSEDASVDVFIDESGKLAIRLIDVRHVNARCVAARVLEVNSEEIRLIVGDSATKHVVTLKSLLDMVVQNFGRHTQPADVVLDVQQGINGQLAMKLQNGTPVIKDFICNSRSEYTLTSLAAVLEDEFPGYPPEQLWLDTNDDGTELRVIAIKEAGPHRCDTRSKFANGELAIGCLTSHDDGPQEGVSWERIKQLANDLLPGVPAEETSFDIYYLDPRIVLRDRRVPRN